MEDLLSASGYSLKITKLTERNPMYLELIKNSLNDYYFRGYREMKNIY